MLEEAAATVGSLLSPVRISTVTLANRLGLGPINPGFLGSDPAAAASVSRFYADFADAGIALVYVGGVAISRDGRSNAGSLVLSDEPGVTLLAAVAHAVHEHGGALAVQLMHAGRQTSSREVGSRLLAASSLPCRFYREVPHEASQDDIGRLVRQFAHAAQLAAATGADLIEIHAAHGYLLSGFLSPHSNRRTDGYGGSTTNRFRILREVLEAIRALVQLPIGVRVNVAENVVGNALVLTDLVEGLVDIKGCLDFVSVTAGVYTDGEDWIIPRRALGSALWRSQAQLLRSALGVPVMLAGNISTLEIAEEVVGSGCADVALMVRSLLADPHLLVKWLGPNRGDIQPCTELFLCKYHSRGRGNVHCPYNPILHTEFHPRRAWRTRSESAAAART